MPDELRSAYAVLGLQPGASLQEVKQQFKTLVRRWHPDRFANDPQGKAEANDRLRVINQAYSTILQSRFGEASQSRREPPPGPAAQDGSAAARANGSARGSAEEAPGDPTPPPVGPPLTRAEIDAMIDALRGHRQRKTIREQIKEDPLNRGLSLVLVGLVWLGILHWKRKSLHYKITDRTIDYEAGLFAKRVETLQLWRVHDIDLRQTFLERLLDIAEIRVFTRDASDPELVLRGLPASRELFEALKNAAELARQQRVLGVVQ